MCIASMPCFALAALIVAWIALLITLFNVYYLTPYSFFYRGRHPLARGEQRKRDAEAFLLSKDMRRRPPPAPYLWLNQTADVSSEAASGSPDWCVGITSIWRPQLQYVHYTVGSLFDTVSEAERRRMHVMLFLADANPQKQLYHAERRGLVRVVDRVVLRGDSLRENAPQGGWLSAMNVNGAGTFVDHLKKPQAKSHAAWVMKESQDYSHVLDYCTQAVPSARYIIVLEDDVVAAQDWPKMLRVALSDLDADLSQDPSMPDILSVAKMAASQERAAKDVVNDSKLNGSDSDSDSPDRRWLYLRLFYTEVYFGFGLHSVHYFTAAVLVVLLVQAWVWFALVPRAIRRKIASTPPYSTIALAYAASIPAAVILIPVIIGRQNMLPEPHGLTREQLNSWGTPALLYPRTQAVRLANLVRRSAHDAEFGRPTAAHDQGQDPMPVDLIIEQCADDEGLLRYTWTPSLFQHIGGTRSTTSVKEEDESDYFEDRTRLYSLSYERAWREKRASGG